MKQWIRAWRVARALRRQRQVYIEECIACALEDAARHTSRPSLSIAAWRLHRLLRDVGITVTFDHIFYRLRRRDRDRVFAR